MIKSMIVVLLLLLSSPLAAAQGDDDDDLGDLEEVIMEIVSTQTWEGEDRDVATDVRVEPGHELVIRGINVTFQDVNFTVAPGGRLVVESLPGDPARFVSKGNRGLVFMSNGTVEIRGLPDAPVNITGMRGYGAATEDTVAFQDGFTIARGSIVARDLVVANYTSGILVTNQADASFFNLTLNSLGGVGVVASSTGVVVENATMRGPGARLYVTLPGPDKPVVVRNVTSDSGIRPFTFRHVFNVTVENLTARHVESCVHLLGSLTLTINGLVCEDFVIAGVRIRHAAALRATNANLTLVNFRASTDKDVPAIMADRPSGLTVKDSVIGPVNWSGIVVKYAPVTLENVTFQGVRDYNVEILDTAPGTAPESMEQLGESGGLGWLLVSYSSAVRVEDPSGQPAPNTNITLTARNGTVVAQGVSRTGFLLDLILESHVIDTSGALAHANYTLHATNPEHGSLTRTGIRGTGAPIIVRLPGGGEGVDNTATPPGDDVDRKAPGLAPVALLALAAAVALARRRRS